MEFPLVPSPLLFLLLWESNSLPTVPFHCWHHCFAADSWLSSTSSHFYNILHFTRPIYSCPHSRPICPLLNSIFAVRMTNILLIFLHWFSPNFARYFPSKRTREKWKKSLINRANSADVFCLPWPFLLPQWVYSSWALSRSAWLAMECWEESGHCSLACLHCPKDHFERGRNTQSCSSSVWFSLLFSSQHDDLFPYALVAIRRLFRK